MSAVEIIQKLAIYEGLEMDCFLKDLANSVHGFSDSWRWRKLISFWSMFTVCSGNHTEAGRMKVSACWVQCCHGPSEEPKIGKNTHWRCIMSCFSLGIGFVERSELHSTQAEVGILATRSRSFLCVCPAPVFTLPGLRRSFGRLVCSEETIGPLEKIEICECIKNIVFGEVAHRRQIE